MRGDYPGQEPPNNPYDDADLPRDRGAQRPDLDGPRGDFSGDSAPEAQRLYQMQLRAEERRLREEERQLAIARRNEIIRRVKRGCFYLIGALEILLGMRFVLQLFGANPNNVFAQGINSLSGPYVAPFSNLFNNPTFADRYTIDFNALIAMGTYALLGVMFVWLLRVVAD